MTKSAQDKQHKISNIVDALSEQRRKWEEGTYAASNAELYALLGKTLDLFLAVRRDLGLSRAVTDVMDIYGIQYNSSTSLALKIVRLVFVGKGRESKLANRAFTYARVLTIAAEARVTGATLPQFISDNHGIDELRRQGGTEETAAQKAERARQYAEAALVNEAAIAPVQMSDDLQPVDGARYSLALVRKNNDGTASIVYGTNNPAAVNNVLTIAGKAIKKQAADQAEQNVAKHDAEKRAENAERVAQQLMASDQFQPDAQVSETAAEQVAL